MQTVLSAADRHDLTTQARRRVKLKTTLALHTLVFLSVHVGLWLAAEAGLHQGRSLPLAGWALGLGIHALVVCLKLLGDTWMPRLIADETRRLEERLR